MRWKAILFSIIIFSLIFLAILFYLQSLGVKLPEFSLKLIEKNKIKKVSSPKNLTSEENKTEEIPLPPIEEANIPKERPQETQEEISKNVSKVISLKITDICSAKMEEITSITEGLTSCLNKEAPYFIVFEKNSTHLKFYLYNESFGEAYNLSNEVLIFYLVVEDISSIEEEMQDFYLEGEFKDYFRIGNYSKNVVKISEGGVWKITKILAILPIYAKSDIASTSEWKKLNFYLRTFTKDYFVGNIWIFVK